MWIFKGDKKVDADSKEMLQYRDSLGAKLPLLSSLLSLQVGCKRAEKVAWCLKKVESTHKDIQDRGSENNFHIHSFQLLTT